MSLPPHAQGGFTPQSMQQFNPQQGYNRQQRYGYGPGQQPPPPPYPPQQNPPPQNPQWNNQPDQNQFGGGGWKPGITQQLRDQLHQEQLHRITADLELKHERAARAQLDRQRDHTPKKDEGKGEKTPRSRSKSASKTRSRSASQSGSRSRSKRQKRDVLSDSETSSGDVSGESAMSPQAIRLKKRKLMQKAAKKEMMSERRKLEQDLDAARAMGAAQMKAELKQARAELAKMKAKQGGAAASGRGGGARRGGGRNGPTLRVGNNGHNELTDEDQEEEECAPPVPILPADVNEKFKSVAGLKRMEDILKTLNDLPSGWDDSKPRGGVDRRAVVSHVVDLHNEGKL
ncbi:hypothetical protein CYMTET_49465 [Cymbomonas tetramitiformis]|uniref:Uncharacterized protein n=1 Tax=Cymbomonas tetramitiformis TaxID=36881 RepID=A0AAE0BRU8_9CHLO|nr:hypothetical protein CYMTET_49465 [Cymbomonas tetramitiformis]